jgi:hypothetical protein
VERLLEAKVPGAQLVQLLDSATENVPTEQLVHEVKPLLEKVPAEHPKQLLRPRLGLYWPLGQAEHDDESATEA